MAADTRMIQSNTHLDDALRAAGYVESDGIGLWTHSDHPKILIDTNAEIPSIWEIGKHDPINLVGTLEDEIEIFASLGVTILDRHLK